MKKICPKCGADMNENAKFCSKCGAKYEVKDEASNKCQKCGRLLDVQMLFCPNCGFPVGDKRKASNVSFEKIKKTIFQNISHVQSKINNRIRQEKSIHKENDSSESRYAGAIFKTVVEIIIFIIFVVTIYNVSFNDKNTPEAAVALQAAKNAMGAGFSESDIEFDVVDTKDDSKFIIKCKPVSDEAQEMYELTYGYEVCFYGIEFGNASGEYFATIGDSKKDVKNKMEW